MRLPLVALCAALLPGAATAAPPAVQVRLAYVGDAADTALSGARQGLDEANVQGRFLGQAYSLEPLTLKAALAPPQQPWVALVAAVPPESLAALAAAHPDAAVLNVSAGDDSLRADCRNNLLHVLPSASMLAAAQAQWRQANPQSAARAQAWHPDFEKYAAAQLNIRYSKAHGQPMDDRAWAGWAAVKMVSDTVARTRSATAADVLAHLRDDLAFDGQKGSEMSFRPNGQLRQPLLLVEDGRIVGEAPVRGVAADDPDSLGGGECAK